MAAKPASRLEVPNLEDLPIETSTAQGAAILCGGVCAGQPEPDNTAFIVPLNFSWDTAPMRLPLHVRILTGAVLGAALGGAAAALLPGHPALEIFLKYVARP